MARLIPILETHMTPPPPPPALSPPLAPPGASFTPSTTAVGGNVFLTAAVGLLPLVAFFVLMGVFKVKTHWCALISLAASALIAVLVFGMPAPMAVLSGAQGLAMGFVPIIYIIIAAVWLYNLTETSGRSQDLKAVFNTIGRGDQRAQALIVAFCFCGLLEGLAGFGAPVAITGAMLVTLGLPPVRAAIATIVGNAINVGFGAMAIPVTTAASLGGAGPVEVAADMGRLTWILCLFIPALLLLILDGARGVRQLWPLALVAGGAAALGHFLTPGASYELTAVVASLLGLTACFVFLLVWTPATPEEHRTEVAAADRPDGGRVALALLPYVLVVVIIAVTKLWRIGAALATTGAAFAFLSPVLGWIGTAVAGSATSAGALFANLQATAAAGAHLDPRLLLAANTIGGGLGKIVSPQNLAIAATAVDAEGADAEILRRAAPFSIGLLLALCALVLAASQGLLGPLVPVP